MTEPHGPKIKYPYKGNVRWAFFKWADIESAFFPGYVYLRRLRIFQTPWFALYLHFIFEPDLDRDPHDHPCNFWALIVRGGYYEQVFPHQFDVKSNYWCSWTPFTLHKMPVDSAHQIKKLNGKTVTLCWFGRRQRQWGFWTADGFVDQETYRKLHKTASNDPFGG